MEPESPLWSGKIIDSWKRYLFFGIGGDFLKSWLVWSWSCTFCPLILQRAPRPTNTEASSLSLRYFPSLPSLPAPPSIFPCDPPDSLWPWHNLLPGRCLPGSGKPPREAMQHHCSHTEILWYYCTFNQRLLHLLYYRKVLGNPSAPHYWHYSWTRTKCFKHYNCEKYSNASPPRGHQLDQLEELAGIFWARQP